MSIEELPAKLAKRLAPDLHELAKSEQLALQRKRGKEEKYRKTRFSTL
jgi:hypothetical protein